MSDTTIEPTTDPKPRRGRRPKAVTPRKPRKPADYRLVTLGKDDVVTVSAPFASPKEIRADIKANAKLLIGKTVFIMRVLVGPVPVIVETYERVKLG